jgi:hypothetical protein
METNLPDCDLLFMDDLHLIVNLSGSLNNLRRGLFEAALAAVLDHAKGKNKKLAACLR